MSDEVLTVNDVASMAVTMEANGMEFYRWAAKRFENEEVKNMFLRLAEEEKEHVSIFEKILKQGGSEETIKVSSSKYLKVVGTKNDIFPHHESITKETVKSPVDVLSLGIQAEKDAILLYHELYNQTKSTEIKSAISKLLEQEKMHLLELRDSMDELRKFD